MMRRAAPFALGLFTLALLPLVPGAARAQATQEGATALEQQIHEWIANTLGPDAKIGARPIQVTADGDHYDLAVPIGTGPDAPNWTANARPLDGGRYAVDNVHFPSPAEFHVKLPQADPTQPGVTADVTYKLTVGSQSAQMLIDPSFATSSTFNSTAQNVDVQTSGGMAPSTSHIGGGINSMILAPATPGRIDVTLDSNLDNYTISSEAPNGNGPFTLTFGKTHLAGNATGLSRERAVQVLQAAIKLGKAMKTPAADAGTTPPADATATAKPDPEVQKDFSTAMLQAMSDLASGASLDETIQDLGLTINGMSGSLHGMQFGFGIKAENGLLQARMNLGADGLTLPDLGLGPMVDLIPTKISLRPVVTGVPGAALLAMGDTSQAGDSPTPDQMTALFANGPITAGVEALTIDVAGAEFTGVGQVAFTSPQEFSGTAQITATNLDVLQQKVAVTPGLAQGVPAIIFLKGIGRSNGNQMVWDLAYHDGRLLVNNQDMSALMGGGPAAPAPVAPPAPPQTIPQITPKPPPAVQQFPPPAGPQTGQPQRRRP